MPNNIAIIGSSGAIGSAFARLLAQSQPKGKIYAFSRSGAAIPGANIIHQPISYHGEAAIQAAAAAIAQEIALDLVIVTIGMLHNCHGVMPEKSLKELSFEKFENVFKVNTILPALVAKYFLPKLNKKHRSIFAVLSARVGSISDNRLGGWYAYRASKAALNMVIKNAAIETARANKNAIVVGLHPGTVASQLTQPFQKNVPADKLFTPDFAAQNMLSVLQNLTPQNSGQCFAWDGTELAP